MPFEFPHCLDPFVGDTGGHLSLFRRPWDRIEECGAWPQTIWYWPFHRTHKQQWLIHFVQIVLYFNKMS